MACSRTPKRRLRPPRSPAWKSPHGVSPQRSAVLFEGARSAEPPMSVGSTGARALRTLPEADAGGASCRPPRRRAAGSRQPAGRSPASARCQRAGDSGIGALVGSQHARSQSRAHRRPARRDLARTGRGTRRARRSDRVGPAQRFLGQPHLLLAQRRAVGGRRVLLVRAAVADVGAHHDERRSVGHGFGRRNGRVDRPPDRCRRRPAGRASRTPRTAAPRPR